MTDVRAKCEKLGWIYDQANGNVTLMRTFENGAGFGMTLKEEIFEDDLRHHVEEFNPEEYATSQVIAKRNGAQGLPGGRELFEIAYAIHDALHELAEEFEEPDDLEIYLGDLNSDAQERLCSFLGGENGNYDVFPIATIRKPRGTSEPERTCFYCEHYADGFCHCGEEDDWACIERDPDDSCTEWKPLRRISSDCHDCERHAQHECEGAESPCYYRKPREEAY